MQRAASWTWIGLTLLLFGTRCSSQDSLPPQGQGGSEDLAGRTGSGGMGTGGEMGTAGTEFGGTTGGGGYGIGGEHGIIGGRGAGGTGTGGIVIETIGGMSGNLPKDGGPDGVVCCPPDPQPNAGCMHLGGAPYNGVCELSCDFQCSINWRIETEQGCPTWRYDTLSPCFLDAGNGGP